MLIAPSASVTPRAKAAASASTSGLEMQKKIVFTDESGERYRLNGEAYATFPGRTGYDENFLGIKLPMPQLDPSVRNSAAPLLADPSSVELKYTHFSTIQNKDRTTPMLTAVNIDGEHAVTDLDRKDNWAFDARIDRNHQMGRAAYTGSVFDRGHQVRRKDAMWGGDWTGASDDGFVYTNAALQHAGLNQRKWLDLENNILLGAIAKAERKTVFTGPVLRDDDPVYDNDGKLPMPTKIPQAFWKVQVWNDPQEGLLAEAFVISQKNLMDKPRKGLSPVHIKPMQFKKYRVTMEKLEEMTHINFGPLKEGPDRAVTDAQAAVDKGIVVLPPWQTRSRSTIKQ